MAKIQDLGINAIPEMKGPCENGLMMCPAGTLPCTPGTMENAQVAYGREASFTREAIELLRQQIRQ